MSYEHQGLVDFASYTADSLSTEKVLSAINTNPDLLLAAMRVAVAAGEIVDIAKRFVIYGKPIDKCGDAASASMEMDKATLAFFRAYAIESGGGPRAEVPVNPRLLHSALGLFGETGEIMEALLKTVGSGEQMDLVNLGEEFGDGFWYIAVGIDELNALTGITLGDWLYRNRQKLVHRAATGGITSSKAERDLAGERAVLEGECRRVE
jgi:NTP pyrophosphatase (non-canonical NTP hydrolase)